MAATNRENAIKQTLKYEGGYTNDPHDPGGATNFGITIIDARKYWKPDATPQDVKTMPLAVAVDIYRQHYWAPMSCDADPAGVDFSSFDYGVNSGINRAITCREHNKNPAPVVWVKAICAERLNFLEHLRNWAYFGRGWGSRVSDVEARAVKMALEGQGTAPPEVKKTLNDESTAAKAKATKEASKGAGTVVAGGSSQVPHAPHHFDFFALPLWAEALIFVGIAALVGLFVWRFFLHQQRSNAYAAVAKEA